MLFSQRKGIKPVKSIIQVDSIDDELKNALWSAVTVWQARNAGGMRTGDFNQLMKDFWLYYYKEPLDKLPGPKSMLAKLRQSFFHGTWYDCYDILEFIASNYHANNIKDEFLNNCNEAMARELSAYRFVGGQITQITSEAEISSIEDALLDTQPLKPVHIHLKTALDFLSDKKSPDYRNSIKESISAVEALCSLIIGSRATLGQAIKAVEGSVNLHPALKGAFSSLYGYTSDASGIRHALMDEPNIDFEDAKFMLVSCSAFINYLISKATKEGISL
jgi:hypothetical protein